MTQARELSPDVALLLRNYIESYEQVEILLLLRSEVGRAWTEEALAIRLGLSAPLIAEALIRLQAAGLVDVGLPGIEKHHTYRLQNESMEATITQLARAYREHPIPVIKQMTANAIERVRTAALRTFADAFIVRKDTNDR